MKNNLKKGLSLIVTIAMMFSLVTGLNAFAAGEKTLNVTSDVADTVKVGETVTQTISLTDFSIEDEDSSAIVNGIRSFKIVVTFDSAKLTAVNVAPAATSTIVSTPISAAVSVDPIEVGEISVSHKTPGKLVILYMDAGNGLGGRSPVLAGEVLKITYTGLAEGNADIALSSGATGDFIDCAFPTSVVSSEIEQRNVTPTFPETPDTIAVTPAIPPITTLEILNTYAFNTATDYVYGIAPSSTVATVKAKFANSDKIVITKGVTPLADTDVVGTGAVISLVVDSVAVDTTTVVIIGDIDGTGTIASNDYAQLKQVIMVLRTVTGAYQLAANIDRSVNGIINSNDYAQLKQVIMVLRTITQAPPAA